MVNFDLKRPRNGSENLNIFCLSFLFFRNKDVDDNAIVSHHPLYGMYTSSYSIWHKKAYEKRGETIYWEKSSSSSSLKLFGWTFSLRNLKQMKKYVWKKAIIPYTYTKTHM